MSKITSDGLTRSGTYLYLCGNSGHQWVNTTFINYASVVLEVQLACFEVEPDH